MNSTTLTANCWCHSDRWWNWSNWTATSSKCQRSGMHRSEYTSPECPMISRSTSCECSPTWFVIRVCEALIRSDWVAWEDVNRINFSISEVLPDSSFHDHWGHACRMMVFHVVKPTGNTDALVILHFWQVGMLGWPVGLLTTRIVQT